MAGKPRSSCLNQAPPCATAMKQAFAFFIFVVAFGIFMPEVLHALGTFLLVLLNKSTAFVNALPTSPAMVSQTIGQ